MRQVSKYASEKGQVLLIVVLAAVISLTVGLSVASRVVTNTKISTDETDSQKALSAAQAGIEQKLKNNANTGTIDFTSTNKSKVTTTSISLIGSQLLINGGNLVSQDDGVDIWLSTYPTYAGPWSGDLKIYWTDNPNSSSSDCSTKNAAIEVVVLTGTTASNAVMSRYAFDSCQARRNGNGFSPTSLSDPVQDTGGKLISPITFDHSITIGVTSGLIARVIPLYANASVAVGGYAAGSTTTVQSLPTQGFIIEATGTAGNATRKIRVFQGFPKLPTEYFPYSLFLP